MAYNDPYRRMRGSRGMSAEDGQRDATDAINYQAGVEKAMSGGFEPKINAGGRVNVEDWMKMGQAQRLRYGEQAPNEFDIERAGGFDALRQPTGGAPFRQPMAAASAMQAPQSPTAPTATAVVLPAPAQQPATPTPAAQSAPLDPNRGYGTYTGRDGKEKSFEPNPEGSISYRGANGMDYFIPKDVQDVAGRIADNRAGRAPSAEQMAAVTPLEPDTAFGRQPAAPAAASTSRNPKGALRKPERKPAPQSPGMTAAQINDASNVMDAMALRQPSAARSTNAPSAPRAFDLTPRISRAPNIDGQPVPTLRPPSPPPAAPPLSVQANLPPGATIDPRRRRLVPDFSMIPTL